MAAINTFYKKNYTEQELKECYDWFEQHQAQFPASLDMEGGIHIPDLHRTVDSLVHKLRKQADGHGIYNGLLANLMMIRHRLEEQL